MPENRLQGCYETVIASLAHRIEYLEDELRWKQKRVEDLEKQNAAQRIELHRLEAMTDNPDLDADPFGGDGDE